MEADVENLTAPQVMLACATNADALGHQCLDLSSINDLAGWHNQAERCHEPASLDGASQLVDGTSQLAGGVLALLDGANT